MTDRGESETASMLAALRKLHEERQRAFLNDWQRSLPFGDEIVDRWQKAIALGFGEGTSIYDSAIVIGDVTVGANTWIGPNVLLDGSGGLAIGDNCSVSAGVQIYTHDSVKWALSGGRAEYERAAVKIGSNTYIGPMTIVTRGVTIGDRCLIGANSIVNKNLDDGSIAFGSTCTIVGRVEVSPDGTVTLSYNEDDGKRAGFRIG
jgi:acetyltransferase-like isoleucine patch superfamily enzyme